VAILKVDSEKNKYMASAQIDATGNLIERTLYFDNIEYPVFFNRKNGRIMCSWHKMRLMLKSLIRSYAESTGDREKAFHAIVERYRGPK